jgi:hypothetical protein
MCTAVMVGCVVAAVGTEGLLAVVLTGGEAPEVEVLEGCAEGEVDVELSWLGIGTVVAVGVGVTVVWLLKLVGNEVIEKAYPIGVLDVLTTFVVVLVADAVGTCKVQPGAAILVASMYPNPQLVVISISNNMFEPAEAPMVVEWPSLAALGLTELPRSAIAWIGMALATPAAAKSFMKAT